MAGGHKLGTLFDCRLTGSLIRLGDDNRKVLGTQERRRALFDAVKAFLVPPCGLDEVREGISLPVNYAKPLSILNRRRE